MTLMLIPKLDFYGNGNQGPSLNDRISQAETISDVHALLAKGRSFSNVTRRTENRWKRTAKLRIRQLQNGARE